ncbi:MAG: glycosyltransferase family 39 protein [Candidatus Levybacteria bacterium]|nr:glycosyltransferase family 39 protein [Candidatus Levybacteria bacterium]
MNRFKIIFILVILLGGFLRFYQLGSNPPSVTWDEASLGYNAYSIYKTGADEYGVKLPLSIRSFDDHKPPLYVYLTVPFVAIFDLSEFSVRLPSAIIGVLSIAVIYFLVKEILQKWDKNKQQLIALSSAFFLAVSPWSLQFSRAAFEGNIGIFFLMLGILLLLKGLKNGRFIFFSSIAFVLSVYSYHSFRLIIPLLLFFLTIFFWQEILRKKLIFIVFFISLVLLTLPVYLSFLNAQDSGSRLSMVTIFSDPTVLDSSIIRNNYDKDNNDLIGGLIHNRRIVYSLTVAKGYLDHFNPDFLFLHGDGGVQHHAVDMGILYLWDLPFILIGLYCLINRRDKYIGILFLLFLLASIPSAITTGTPHPVRAIALMPGFHIFSAVGFIVVILRILEVKMFFTKIAILGLVGASLFFNFIYYTHQYYVHTPIEYGYFWQYGYKEAMLFAKDNQEKFDKIIITYRYDQPYIYYLFYNKIDPTWYQKNWDYNRTGLTDRFKRVIGKYEFRNIDYSKDSLSSNTLLIGIPSEIPDSAEVVGIVKFPDGNVAFRITKT